MCQYLFAIWKMFRLYLVLLHNVLDFVKMFEEVVYNFFLLHLIRCGFIYW